MLNIYKKNIYKFFILIVGITILAGCSMLGSKKMQTVKDTNISTTNVISTTKIASVPTTNQPTETKAPSISNSETVLTLYIYDYEDYEKPKEKKLFSIEKENYENNLTVVLNDIFKETEIKFNNVAIDQKNNCITADIPKAVANNFDSGSCMGIILTNELIMTLLNLPGIQKAIVTVDGEEGLYGNHFSFEGIFVKDGETKFKSIVEKE